MSIITLHKGDDDDDDDDNNNNNNNNTVHFSYITAHWPITKLPQNTYDTNFKNTHKQHNKTVKT
jgi:hypothetical protein